MEESEGKWEDFKTITDSKVLRKLTEEVLTEDTVFRIVQQLEHGYSLHQIDYEGETYYVGAEADYGLAIYGSTDLLDAINVMETYLLHDVAVEIDMSRYATPYVSSVKNLIN